MADDKPHDEDFWGKDDLQPSEYSPITPGEIRCLVLEPGRGCESLSGTLEVYRLADDPHYEAISYIWGEMSRCEVINCDGARMFITPNLHDALQQRRLPDRRRVLWADSICINQDDDQEKSHQVSVMNKIYSQATRVLICLGPDRTGDAQQMQAFLCEFNGMFEDALEDARGKWDAFPWAGSDDPILNDPRWPILISLTWHPWFKRGWVVQEAGLAREAIVFWGEARLSWHWMLRMVTWGLRRAGLFAGFHGYLRNKTLWGNLWEMHLSMHQDRYKNEAITMWVKEDFSVKNLLVTLNLARWCSMCDDRDRIYGFLGLPQAADIRDGLSVSYRKTVSQVCQDFACGYLDCTQDLSLLHYVQPTPDTMATDSGYPSWIPLWQHRSCTFSLHGIIRRKILPQYAPRSCFHRRVGDSILKVRALTTDTIVFFSSPLSESMTIDDIAAVWREVRGYRGRLIYEQVQPMNAFLRALTCGRVPVYLQTCEQVRAQIKAFLHRLARDESDAGRGGPHASLDPGGDRFDGPFTSILDVVQDFIHQRRVAVTQRGYYCLVSTLAREADTCAIIYGTTAPFILRNSGKQDYYKVVGEAFVVSNQLYDSAEGEMPRRMGSGFGANEDWLNWDVEEKDIYLC